MKMTEAENSALENQANSSFIVYPQPDQAVPSNTLSWPIWLVSQHFARHSVKQAKRGVAPATIEAPQSRIAAAGKSRVKLLREDAAVDFGVLTLSLGLVGWVILVHDVHIGIR